MPRPQTDAGLWLSKTLLAPARGDVCRLEVCHGACCAGGIWVDVVAVQAILAAEPTIAPRLPAGRRDPDQWFSGESFEHSDFPSGIANATTVLPRPDGSQRPGCTFLEADNTCALEHASAALGLGWPGLKPFDCATFPLLRSEGTVGRDRSVHHVEGQADCKPPASGAGPAFHQVFRREVELAIGRQGAERLERWQARRDARRRD